MVFYSAPEYHCVLSGQIAFPGGKAEASDSSKQHTALRETKEAIGVNTVDIGVIGKLSQLYIPPTNFLVEPFVDI